MVYEPSTTAQMLKDAGGEPAKTQSVGHDQPYDRARAHGSNGTGIDTAAEIERVAPRPGSGGNGLVLETRGNSGEYGIRHSAPPRHRGVGGLGWRMALDAMRDRPAHHSVAPPAEVTEAWSVVEAAIAAAEQAEGDASELFKEANSAPPRKADWNAVEDAEDNARSLLREARAARSRYDAIAEQHLDGKGDWALAVAQAVPAAHADATLALAAATEAVRALDAALAAAVAAGRARGESAVGPQHMRAVLDTLSQASADLARFNPASRVTENPLPVWSRQEREDIARFGSEKQLHELYLQERREHRQHTDLTKGFIPDIQLLAQVRGER